MIHLAALLGVLGISFSAVFVRLAAVSPVTATLFRAVYALPPLALVWTLSRGGDPRAPRARVLAFASGVVLGIELAFWHKSIALIGVGLATVLANVQVVVVATVAWVLYGERPGIGTALIIGAILMGVALTSGLARPDAYGTAPIAGVLLGAFAGACYAVFLLMFRAANRALAPTAGPLLDSTAGMAVGALLCAPFDPAFAFGLSWPAHGWLVLLALVSQVIGWLLIAPALPRLPALETSILLLVQPVFALAWGVLLFAERLSALQWLGAALVLAGVGSLSLKNLRERHVEHAAR
jgi:drug/metabolite transporter (DMT)-like permease